MNIETSRRTSRSVALIVTSALGVLMAVGVMVWWFWPFELGIGGDNTMEGMVTQIRTWGSWAALGSIMLMVAHSFLPFPSELITLANGMVFGPCGARSSPGLGPCSVPSARLRWCVDWG